MSLFPRYSAGLHHSVRRALDRINAKVRTRMNLGMMTVLTVVFIRGDSVWVVLARKDVHNFRLVRSNNGRTFISCGVRREERIVSSRFLSMCSSFRLGSCRSLLFVIDMIHFPGRVCLPINFLQAYSFEKNFFEFCLASETSSTSRHSSIITIVLQFVRNSFTKPPKPRNMASHLSAVGRGATRRLAAEQRRALSAAGAAARVAPASRLSQTSTASSSGAAAPTTAAVKNLLRR